MRRANADDSFTWQPFDHGRQRRMAALVAVGLCCGLVGLAVGRASSGVGRESPRAPAFASAVPKNNETAVPTSTPTPSLAKKNDQSLLPASPQVVLLNPSREKQTASVGERELSEQARPPLHRERPGPLAPATTVEKKNNQGVPPVDGAPRIGQPPNRAHVSTVPGGSKKPRALPPEGPATLADYGALRDYMMGH